ncbi:MAG: hypothetical protein ACK551_08065 [Vampirovibrionales bacterium]
MINFAPNNNALLSLLTSNNPTTTAVAGQPQTPSIPQQQTFGFPTVNAAANPLPSFSGAAANGTGSSIFAGLMNPNTQQGQTPLTGTNPMFAQPATTAPSGNDALGLAGLDQLLAGANQFVASMPPSLAGASAAGGISPTAPRQAVAPAPQGSPTIVLTPGALKELQEGQNLSEATAENPETQAALNAKIEALTAEINKQEGLPKSTEALAKIASLETQLAELQDAQNKTGWQTRVETLEDQIRALKDKATATTPKPKTSPVVAQAAKSKLKTT